MDGGRGGPLTTSHMNGSPSTRGVCRYFSARGECFYGDSCAYLHSNPSRSNSLSGASRNHGDTTPESQLSGCLGNSSTNFHPSNGQQSDFIYSSGVKNPVYSSSHNPGNAPVGIQSAVSNGKNAMMSAAARHNNRPMHGQQGPSYG